MKAYFEWDEEKDALNQKKHGVSFVEAQHAFLDPKRILAEDITHCGREEILLFWSGRFRNYDGTLYV